MARLKSKPSLEGGFASSNATHFTNSNLAYLPSLASILGGEVKLGGKAEWWLVVYGLMRRMWYWYGIRLFADGGIAKPGNLKKYDHLYLDSCLSLLKALPTLKPHPTQKGPTNTEALPYTEKPYQRPYITKTRTTCPFPLSPPDHGTWQGREAPQSACSPMETSYWMSLHMF